MQYCLGEYATKKLPTLKSRGVWYLSHGLFWQCSGNDLGSCYQPTSNFSGQKLGLETLQPSPPQAELTLRLPFTWQMSFTYAINTAMRLSSLSATGWDVTAILGGSADVSSSWHNSNKQTLVLILYNGRVCVCVCWISLPHIIKLKAWVNELKSTGSRNMWYHVKQCLLFLVVSLQSDVLCILNVWPWSSHLKHTAHRGLHSSSSIYHLHEISCWATYIQLEHLSDDQL